VSAALSPDSLLSLFFGLGLIYGKKNKRRKRRRKKKEKKKRKISPNRLLLQICLELNGNARSGQ
jgi:hypothetical protein